MLKRKLNWLLFSLCVPQLALALNWQDMWFNPNQQGARLLAQQKPAEAVAKFSDSNWKGVAYYRDKQYEQAYNEFKQDHSARGLYNQGNALANLQKYSEAIEAYNQALKLQPNFPEAKHNRDLVEKLKNQPPQKDQKDQKDQKNQAKPNQPEQKPTPSPSPQPTPAANKPTAAKNSPQPTPTPQNMNGANSNNPPQNYQDQQVRAALAQIPDAPGGLLRNKFLRDYQLQQGGTND